jgi:methionyl-tRNA formyltransferase
MSLKVVFAGTPAFAVPTLARLLDSCHSIEAVWTQPDRPAGRGRQFQASPVKQLALSRNLPIFQPERLGAACLLPEVPDVMVVVAYGLLLPQAVLDWPRYGCINLHPSLLPRWRGAAPIQHALLKGDAETGVSVMQMTAGMDAGPVLAQEISAVAPGENSEMLHERLAKAGADLVLQTLDDLARGDLAPVDQDASRVTYAPKIDKGQALIDWRQPAADIVNQVRALNPKPVAFTYFRGQRLRIWQAQVVDCVTEAVPGTIVAADSSGVVVATGHQCLSIVALQLPGRRCLSVAEFMNAHAGDIQPGETILLNNEGRYEE